MITAHYEDMRRNARRIFLAGVHAAEPAPLVHAALLNAPELHHVDRRIHVLAVGKAAGGMAAAALETLGARVARTVVISPRGMAATSGATGDVGSVRFIEAGHPLPDDNSIAAARTALHVVSHATPDDALVVLLSGGASALMALPAHGITLGDYRTTTELLQLAGASIDELNCVRKHIDVVKGGNLAHAAQSHAIVGLIISDVADNRVDVIGSGPLAADPTTYAEALDVLERHNLSAAVPTSVLLRLRDGARGRVPENPAPGSADFQHVRLQVLADNTTATDAAAACARRLGYDVVPIAEPVAGPASDAGLRLGSQLAAPSASPHDVCIIAGGETTVHVTGDGLGGRNQELALAAALALDGTVRRVLLSAGTDGIDGTTPAAGAVVDGSTIARMRAAGIDPVAALARNDSHTALAASDDLLVTGHTGTNVMDLQVLLRHHETGIPREA